MEACRALARDLVPSTGEQRFTTCNHDASRTPSLQSIPIKTVNRPREYCKHERRMMRLHACMPKATLIPCHSCFSSPLGRSVVATASVVDSILAHPRLE